MVGGEEGSSGCLEPGDLAEVGSGLPQERGRGVEEPSSEPALWVLPPDLHSPKGRGCVSPEQFCKPWCLLLLCEQRLCSEPKERQRLFPAAPGLRSPQLWGAGR